MEEIKERRKRRAIRVAITEFFMVLSVVLLVIIFMFIVMGYNIGENLSLERTGLVQLNSYPTGATVTIDDSTLFSRTNLSRTLASGTHQITLEKDGYDTWTKTITVNEGLFHRITYPRLFLKDRVAEAVAELPELSRVSVAPDRNTLLAYYGEPAAWYKYTLNSSELASELLDLTPALALCSADIVPQEWALSSDRFLALNHCEDGTTNWVLVDIKDPSRTVNLSLVFGLDFSKIVIENNSSDRLIVLENGNLHKINVSSLELSKILLAGVSAFSYKNGVISYLSTTTVQDDLGTETAARVVGIYRIGDLGGTDIVTISSDEPVSAIVDEYYQDQYLFVAVGDKLMIYRGEFPAYGQSPKRLKLISEAALSFFPASLTLRGKGELVIARNGADISALDLETLNLSAYTIDDSTYWIDDFMFAGISSDGWLTVYDFDHTNARVIAGSVSDFPTVISVNNKYIYYIKESALVREKIN